MPKLTHANLATSQWAWSRDTREPSSVWTTNGNQQQPKRMDSITDHHSVHQQWFRIKPMIHPVEKEYQPVSHKWLKKDFRKSVFSALPVSPDDTDFLRFSSQIGQVQWEKDPSGLLCSCFSCTVSWCPSLSVVDVFGVFAGNQMLLQQCHCVHSLSLQAQALDEWIVCRVVQTAQSLLPQKRTRKGWKQSSNHVHILHHINLDVHYYTYYTGW